jgi:DGQHR domain-containing protein
MKKKLEKIGSFLDKKGVFYNNIILSFEHEPKFNEEKGEMTTNLPPHLKFGTLKLPKVYCSAWIIDGQHRLFGFTRARLLKSQQRLLNVLAIYNPKETRDKEEAEAFYVINNTQTKISPDLLWDLLGKIKPETFGGLISNIVKELNSRDPFKDKIYIPSISGIEKRKDIPISYFCTALKNLRLIGDVDKIFYRLNKRNNDKRTPVNLLVKYFKVLQNLFKNNKEVNDFIFTHNGVAIMLEVLKGVLIYYDNKLPSEKNMYNLLKPIREYLVKNFPNIKDLAKSAENRKDIAQDLLQKIFRKEEYEKIVYLRKKERKRERELGKIDYGI